MSETIVDLSNDFKCIWIWKNPQEDHIHDTQILNGENVAMAFENQDYLYLL